MPRSWLAPALLCGAVVAAYANSFFGVFQFDDYNVIVGAAPVHSWENWLADLGRGLRPLLKLSYLMNWSSGAGLPGFHLFNLLVHLANVFLVYALARLFGERVAPQRDWRWPALAAALLFAVHPVHSEAVTYLSGRSTSLMTLFYLAALWAYVQGTLAQRRGAWLLFSLGLFALALLVKESAIVFPFALLVWEWSCRTPWRAVVARQWPFWLLFVLGSVLLLLHPRYWSLIWDSMSMLSLHDGFLTQLNGAGFLLGQLLWPVALNIDPPLLPLHEVGKVLPQLLIFFVLLVASWYFRATRPWISLGLGWALLHLLLLNTIFVRSDIANERQLYWADWALFLLAAVELDQWLGRKRARVALLTVSCMLAWMTVERNMVYRSEVVLWEDTVAKSPYKARAFNNLGYAYQLAGCNAEAAAAYRRALVLQPDYPRVAANLAALRSQSDATSSALRQPDSCHGAAPRPLPAW